MQIRFTSNRNPSGVQAVRPILLGMKMCSLFEGASLASWGVMPDSGKALFSAYRTWNRGYVRDVKLARRAVWDQGLGTLLVDNGRTVFGLRLYLDSSRTDRPNAVTESVAVALAQKALARL